MTSAQVVETSVKVTSNSPSQDYTHPDDHNLPTYDMTPGFKPFAKSHLVRPKDTVDPTKQDGVVYRIPCECGKVYIGEAGRSMHERIQEDDRDIRLARTQTSAVSEHAHETSHYRP